MTNQKQRETDRDLLKASKEYNARVTLLRDIGPRHGVRIYPLLRDKKDQLKSTFIRHCEIHGKEEVKMQAFMRGNFGCPHCARAAQSQMYAQIRNG